MSPLEIIAGVVGVTSSIVVAFLAYRRGARADDAAQDHAANATVYAGYGGLLQRLQEDNASLRDRITEMEKHPHGDAGQVG